ncbi:MAG: hypothetical protein A3K19_27655 [Lentisphaerae bacterium RIFOXYB12_FULL_65_16]|nr:MAG: hypothetical protein A3K18_25025 [Lentisphaerae bacterium RIFOXYA12_64_32]OGV86080.1 MAG: hypothetical protein A3K19_27655 [Lentisphaerae bacterium RIFOXYB12_FULL_65_16]
MTKLRDNFWLWGQNPGSHHHPPDNPYNLPGTNLMDSAAGGKFFGIPNCCRVAMTAGPEPPFDAEAEKLKDFRQVVWSAVGAGGVTRNSDDKSDLDEVLRQAAMHANVTGAVLDDFFASVEGFKSSGKIARHSLGSITSMRDRLHGFPGRKLDLWMVWYTYQLDFRVADYISLCDVVTLWTWKGSDLARLEENLAKLVTNTPGKRRLAGCYMWNYGERKPLSMKEMKDQLDVCHRWIRQGDIEGIVVCSNCIADIGLDTVELTREWIADVGDEKMPAVR